MTNTNPVLASIGPVTLSTAEFLESLLHQRQLLLLLIATATKRWLATQAAEAGLHVADAELQTAADAFRSRHSLYTREQTAAWLAKEKLSLEDFENGLEQELLLDKFIDHVTADRLESHFEQHRSEYDRLQLRHIVLDRKDLAQELLSQILQEGADFSYLARKHCQNAHHKKDGLLRAMFRAELTPAIQTAVAGAQVGAVVGPVAAEEGFYLVLVESSTPAELDAHTRSWIRKQLFDLWFADRLRESPMTFPYLEQRLATSPSNPVGNEKR